jgi:hypothetical protein
MPALGHLRRVLTITLVSSAAELGLDARTARPAPDHAQRIRPVHPQVGEHARAAGGRANTLLKALEFVTRLARTAAGGKPHARFSNQCRGGSLFRTR